MVKRFVRGITITDVDRNVPQSTQTANFGPHRLEVTTGGFKTYWQPGIASESAMVSQATRLHHRIMEGI
jgi:hypothetical protein